MRTNLLLGTFVCLLSFAALAVSPTKAEIPTPIATAALDNPPSLWRQVMRHFYGPYDDNRRCWIGQGRTGEATTKFCMRPHKLETVTAGDERRSYLVTGGYRIPASGKRDTCHACPGIMGMIVLANDGETLSLVARNSLHEAYGAWGRIPAKEEFSFQKLGHKNRYGWLIRSGWTGQGVTHSWVTVYGHVSDEVRNLGNIPLGFDEKGNCVDGKHLHSGRVCTDYTYDMRLDTNDWRSDFYGIELRLTGNRGGELLDQTFRALFDRDSGTYRLPDSLPSDG